MTACLGLKPTSFGRVRRALALREAARTRRSAGLSSASPISRQGPPGPQNITGGIHLPVMAAAADGPGPRPGGKRPRRLTRVGGGVRQAPGQGVGLHLAPQVHGFDGDHFVAAHETPDPFVHRALAAGGGFLRKHCHRPAARRLPVTAWGLGGQGDDRGLRDRVGALPRHPSEVHEGTRGGRPQTGTHSGGTRRPTCGPSSCMPGRRGFSPRCRKATCRSLRACFPGTRDILFRHA